jgi:hypothetical protein
MPLTTEQRIELLKKAREAKAKKKEERDALKPTPVKGRPKKTLDITEPVEATKAADEEIEEIIENVEEKIMPSGRSEGTKPKPNIPKRTTKKKETEEAEEEPEIVEQVEVRKIKKPKRRIVRKIIKEQYDSESTEEEIEEVIYKPPKHKSKAKVKEVEMPREQTPPREPEIRQSRPTLNIFGY